jgi:hypothetical protein
MSCYRIEIYESGNVETPLAIISSSSPLLAIASPDSAGATAVIGSGASELVINPETGASLRLRREPHLA